MDKKERLNEKQALFVEFYASTKNGKQSAIKAGYAEKTAHVTASKLLNIGKVGKAVDKRINELEKSLKKQSEITLEKILEAVAAVAFSDIGQVVDWSADGGVIIKDKDDLTLNARRSIKKIIVSEYIKLDSRGNEIGKTVRTMIEQKDSLKAIEMVAKLLGYWVDKNELTGKDGKPIEVQPTYDEKAITAKVMELMGRPGREFT